MDRILYISSGGFPFENARSMRMRSFCELFTSLGYDVDVISDWASSEAEASYWRCLISRDRDGYFSASHLKRLCRYYQDVSRALDNEQYQFAFVTEMPERVRKVQSLCRMHDVPTIGESCEWYDSSTWKFGVFDPHNFAFQLAHSFWYKRWNAVVSITRLLNNYYCGHGVPSVVVPTILDVANTAFRIDSNAGNRDVNLLFAGSLGGTKDGVKPMVLAAMETADIDSSRKVVINILGPSVEQLKNSFGNELYDRAIKSGVLVVHGSVPQDEVAAYWRWADYGLFLRPRRRSSDAGFPTKLGEGMAVGTPFITNKTGDIPIYIENKRDGFLLDDCTVTECRAIVNLLLSFSNKEHSLMRSAARRCAELCFDYRLYENQISSLVHEIKGGRS